MLHEHICMRACMHACAHTPRHTHTLAHSHTDINIQFSNAQKCNNPFFPGLLVNIDIFETLQTMYPKLGVYYRRV